MKYTIKRTYRKYFFLGVKIKGVGEGGSKNKNLGHLRKLNQILYIYIFFQAVKLIVYFIFRNDSKC